MRYAHTAFTQPPMRAARAASYNPVNYCLDIETRRHATPATQYHTAPSRRTGMGNLWKGWTDGWVDGCFYLIFDAGWR